MIAPADLPARWRRRASLLAAHGARGPAATLRRAADELESALSASADELLNLRRAAAESGYSAERLRHMVAAGQLPNAGRKGAPRLRRADLPRKTRANSGSSFDPAAAANRLLRRVEGV